MSRTIVFLVALALVPQIAHAEKSKAFNPDLSVNFLGLGQWGTGLSDDRAVIPHNGLTLQEAEMQFFADVDPYFRASALFSVAQENGSTDFGIDPEEIYLETLSLPFVTIRAGKYKLALGKHNQLHTHAFPFIDAPRIHTLLLGDEGLNEVAVSASVLIPISWYSEVTVQGFDPKNETIFGSPTSGSLGGLVRLKNLWDISDELTFELGFSGARAKNELNHFASILAADATFKWRPSVGGKYHALVWSNEYLYGDRKGEALEKLGGIATWLQYQFAERWWIQGRTEFVGLPHSDGILKEIKQSALIGFFPSEFSGLRLQYDHRKPEGTKHEHTIALQYNISIGAHPAHAY